MTILRTIEGSGKRAHDTAGELAERIKELVYEYEGVPLATAIGALEIAKWELLREQEE